jgi:cytoskeletal protein RodZ
MDMNIGEYFNSVRNEKNLTLEEVSETTKIKVRILEAIEANKFDDLGGLGYVKALLMTYAKAINADKEKVLQMIDQNYKGIQLKYSRPLPEQSPKKYQFHMNLVYLIFLIILIAVLTVFTVKLYREGKLNSPFFKIFEGHKSGTTEVPEDSLKTETKSESVEPELSAFDPEALHDTTNYTSELLFKSQANPYEYTK